MIYHYHALYQDKDDVIHHIDGVIVSGKPIITMDDYQELKRNLSLKPSKYYKNLVIDSLSILER